MPYHLLEHFLLSRIHAKHSIEVKSLGGFLGCITVCYIHFSFDGLDEDGNVLSTNLGIDTAKTHTTVPFGPDTAIANLGTALESLISEYDACEFDEYGAWFERASKVVPFLWD